MDAFQEIAEALLITDNTVRKHLKDYEDLRKLKPQNGGSAEKLSLAQSKELESHLGQYTYLYVKDIVAYVSFTYGILYTEAGMRSWLCRHNFSYKKPSLVPGKANMNQQEQWIKAYQKLKANLLSDEAICFIDGVHPTHNTCLSYGWIKKGVRKELHSNTGRSRLNLSGAIDIASNTLIVQEDKTLNAESTISFLQKIECSYPLKQKVYVICDNARYYKNKTVLEYLEQSKIEMIFLPTYSPNLNPIERLWKLMKERVLYNRYYEKFDDFYFSSCIILYFLIMRVQQATYMLCGAKYHFSNGEFFYINSLSSISTPRSSRGIS